MSVTQTRAAPEEMLALTYELLLITSTSGCSVPNPDLARTTIAQTFIIAICCHLLGTLIINYTVYIC